MVPNERIAGMRKVRKFFDAMFSEWGSGLSGPASVPLAITALWVSGPAQKFLYGFLAAILGFFSAYRIWLKENGRADTAESEIERLKKKYFDERPRLGLTVLADEGEASWRKVRAAIGPSVQFYVNLLYGRVAKSVRFDPIPSSDGKYIIHFDNLPFVNSENRKPVTYEVFEIGMPRMLPRDRDKMKSVDGEMLYLFLSDAPKEPEVIRYVFTARFDDDGQQRSQDFHVTFDRYRLRLSVE